MKGTATKLFHEVKKISIYPLQSDYRENWPVQLICWKNNDLAIQHMCTLLLQYLYCYSKKVLQDDKRLLFTQSLSATLCLLYLQAFISSYVLFIAPFKWSTLHFCFLTIAKWDDEDIIQ